MRIDLDELEREMEQGFRPGFVTIPALIAELRLARDVVEAARTMRIGLPCREFDAALARYEEGVK